MALRISRRSTDCGRPPGLGLGIRGWTSFHWASVRSVGYFARLIPFSTPKTRGEVHFSHRLLDSPAPPTGGAALGLEKVSARRRKSGGTERIRPTSDVNRRWREWLNRRIVKRIIFIILLPSAIIPFMRPFVRDWLYHDPLVEGVRVVTRRTTLDLTDWAEVSAKEMAEHVKKSRSIFRNRFTVQRLNYDNGLIFVHRIGTTSGIDPYVSSDSHNFKLIKLNNRNYLREWNILLDVSNEP